MRRLLVLIDPTQWIDGVFPDYYLNKVTTLSLQLDALVELYAVGYSGSLHNAYRFDREAEKQAIQGYVKGLEKQLVEISQVLQSRGVSVGYDVDWHKDYAATITAKANHFSPDLIVAPFNLHKGSYVLNQGQWKLVAEVEQPLLVIKESAWGSHPRILAAIDPFHPGSRSELLELKIIEVFKKISQALVAEQHVLHAFTTIPQATIFNEHVTLNFQKLQEGITQQHKEALAELFEAQALHDAIPHLEQGEFHEEIEDLCQSALIDVIVMGSVSRGITDRLLIGSSVERIMDSVDADLLLINDK